MDALKSNAFPVIGNQPIAEIGTLELLDALRPIEKRGSLEVASRVAQRCGAVFRYAVQTGRIKSNPAADLRGALKTRKAEHRPALMAADLPDFLAKLESYDGYIVIPASARRTGGRPITGEHELVFASQIEPRKPMSENTLLYAMYRMG